MMRSPKSSHSPDPAVFSAMLQQLNPAQRAAVEHIEGPVLVIAGPGTGKTHMLATRIAYILDTTDAYPSNILCLTFTDAGVQAMRQRLLQIIGPDAHKVHIFTFHAFCNKVIRENLDIFGQQNLERCSPIEQSEIIRQLLQGLPWEHPLKKGLVDLRFYERHLIQLFRWMKMENWTAAHMESAIADYLTGLPEKPEFVYQVSRGATKKGSPKTAKIADETRKMEKLLAAAQVFDAYQELLSAARTDKELAEAVGEVEQDFEREFLRTVRAVFPHWKQVKSLQAAHDLVQFVMQGMGVAYRSAHREQRARRVIETVTDHLERIYLADTSDA